jgi:hypothetical protein
MLLIDKKKIFQYVLVYIMLLVPGSNLFTCYLTGNVKYYFVIGLFVLCFIGSAKYREVYGILLTVILFASVLFTRLLTNGAGIGAFFDFAVCVLTAHMAICCDREFFLARFIKMVELLALISVVFWLVFLFFPTLVERWPAQEYLINAVGSPGYETYWYGKGLYLYSYVDMHGFRNCGFYTEPGKYQVVLNSALLILLFWRNKLGDYDERKYKRAVFLVFIAIVTCQSTTGYIATLLILLFFLIVKQPESALKRARIYVVCLVVVSAIALFAEYSVNGTSSILQKQLLDKLFPGSYLTIDFSSGSGQYRTGMILFGLNMIVSHPLGVGYYVFAQMKNSYGTGLVAASIITYAAIYGVISWLILMITLMYPVFKKERISVALLFVLLFINTTLAQTHLLYPALIMIPICLWGEAKLIYAEEDLLYG